MKRLLWAKKWEWPINECFTNSERSNPKDRATKKIEQIDLRPVAVQLSSEAHKLCVKTERKIPKKEVIKNSTNNLMRISWPHSFMIIIATLSVSTRYYAFC